MSNQQNYHSDLYTYLVYTTAGNSGTTSGSWETSSSIRTSGTYTTDSYWTSNNNNFIPETEYIKIKASDYIKVNVDSSIPVLLQENAPKSGIYLLFDPRTVRKIFSIKDGSLKNKKPIAQFDLFKLMFGGNSSQIFNFFKVLDTEILVCFHKDGASLVFGKKFDQKDLKYTLEILFQYEPKNLFVLIPKLRNKEYIEKVETISQKLGKLF
jgi:hypothetical protein